MRSQRLDAIRGCAIIGMVLFHAHYILLNIFWYAGLDFPPIMWHIFGRAVAITFIVVAGISFRLSTVNKPTSVVIQSSIKRGVVLSGIALLISLITFIWFHEQRILFGIIHFFALVAIISPFFLYFWRWNILIGIVIIGLGSMIDYIPATTDILFPIWFITSSFYSADYYPLIPWLWYFLIGYGAMHLYWGNNTVTRWMQMKYTWMAPLALIGRYSLLLYVLHVPILYLCFMLIF